MSFVIFLCTILPAEHKWSPRSPKKMVSIELNSMKLYHIGSFLNIQFQISTTQGDRNLSMLQLLYCLYNYIYQRIHAFRFINQLQHNSNASIYQINIHITNRNVNLTF